MMDKKTIISAFGIAVAASLAISAISYGEEDPASIQHRYMTPSMRVSTNAWLSVSGRVERTVADATDGFLRTEKDPLFSAWKKGDRIEAGSTAYAFGPLAVAIGADSKAIDQQSTAIGYSANAVETLATAIGAGAYGGGYASVAIGSSAYAGEGDSVAIGEGAYSHGIGTFNITATSPSLFYFEDRTLQSFLDAYAKPSVTNGLASKDDVAAKADKTSVYTKSEVDAKVGSAVVKDAENVVTRSFSIKRTYGNYEQSLSFGDNDPSGPSIVVNRLYSTAESSYFSGLIAFIPSSGEKTSLLSRIAEYSAASWNARKEVESIVSSSINSTNPTFSNAVLAVGLNIDTNSVAVLNEIASTFGGFPIEGTATTVGGLLAALAAAVAWLRRNKADKAELRYALDTATTEMVDRTVNFVTITDTNKTLTFPAAVEGKTRDFLLRIDAANLATGGSLTITKPTGATIYGDAFPSPATGKQYLVAITETAANEFYIRTIEITITT